VTKIWVFNGKRVTMFAVLFLVFIAAMVYLQRNGSGDAAVLPAAVSAPTQERNVYMVTGEFATKTKDGKEIEAYRWDPGTIPVKEGERVKLHIYGVNGASHSFIIEGLGVEGKVVKGKVTSMEFTAKKEGIYPIICLDHPDIAHNGPMIGYIVVD
jgi:heme/copper-type cytochrome/quinol oxidase subunit 2